MDKGSIHIYCGEGKGKTTAAIGQGIQEASQGRSVIIIQFMKERNAEAIGFVQRLEPEIKLFRIQKAEEAFEDLPDAEKAEEIKNLKNALIFARKVLEWGADKPVIGKFFTFCLEKGHKGGQKLQEKAGRGLFVALLLFVGIPLPGTGAWTGTLAASLLDMDFKSSVIAVMCGVVLAGVIMGLLSMGVFGALGTIF